MLTTTISEVPVVLCGAPNAYFDPSYYSAYYYDSERLRSLDSTSTCYTAKAKQQVNAHYQSSNSSPHPNHENQ
jgi:hypothetical protein